MHNGATMRDEEMNDVYNDLHWQVDAQYAQSAAHLQPNHRSHPHQLTRNPKNPQPIPKIPIQNPLLPHGPPLAFGISPHTAEGNPSPHPVHPVHPYKSKLPLDNHNIRANIEHEFKNIAAPTGADKTPKANPAIERTSKT